MAPFWCDYGYNIHIGRNFFANHNTIILDGGKVVFGDNVFIGPNCGFYTAGHPIDAESRNKGLEYAYPIVVGDNVWIGAGVHVMPGVTIGSNVVIVGGSIVVKDIPDNCIAVGNPCKVIRRIQQSSSAPTAPNGLVSPKSPVSPIKTRQRDTKPTSLLRLMKLLSDLGETSRNQGRLQLLHSLHRTNIMSNCASNTQSNLARWHFQRPIIPFTWNPTQTWIS